MSGHSLLRKVDGGVEEQRGTAGAGLVAPRAYRVPTSSATYRMKVDTTSRRTQVLDADAACTVLVYADVDVYMQAGTTPTAAPPTAPAAAGDYASEAAGSILLLAGNQTPVLVGRGERLAFICESAGVTANVTYTKLEN